AGPRTITAAIPSAGCGMQSDSGATRWEIRSEVDRPAVRPSYLTRRRTVGVTLVLVALLVLSVVLAAGIGPVPASLLRAICPGGSGTMDRAIIVQTRIPRV